MPRKTGSARIKRAMMTSVFNRCSSDVCGPDDITDRARYLAWKLPSARFGVRGLGAGAEAPALGAAGQVARNRSAHASGCAAELGGISRRIVEPPPRAALGTRAATA